MTYTYDVRDCSSGSRLKKTNLGNRGKIVYHKIKDKTLLDYVKNKANEGCRDLPLASARTLYPRLTFVDDEGMQELCKSMPTCLRNELEADLLLNE